MGYEFKNATILVVDDMQPMLALTSSLLKIFGFDNVMMARDGEEGFEMFCEHSPDLVLTDWLMEPCDGTELIRKIRNDPKSPNKFVPVIMMTGYSHKMRVEQARDSGITEFLVKPFRAKDLYSRIEQLIEKPRRFVDAEVFFGPDRRRKRPKNYAGPQRRDADEFSEIASMPGKEAADLLRELKKQAKKTAENEEK